VGVAFAPLLGLMSGAINPDALLCAVSAILFYCLARGFRRGLTPRLAVSIGAVIAAGLLTKLTFLGLLPGALLGLLVLTARLRGRSKRAALRCLALAITVAASPFCLYLLANAISGGSAKRTSSTGFASSAVSKPILGEVSYIWQFYLPRLPAMHDYFPGLSTTRQLWVNGFVGLYGWLDTVFPTWVYTVALVPIGLLSVLLLRTLFVSRGRLLERRAELIVYAAIAAGLLVIIAASDYLVYPKETGAYSQPRYLLPLIALYGGGLALAARGAGRRWGPVAGASLVVLLIAHDLFSQLLEISRFYG
jgi:4-amino-4-deoxy-L-arabinose transferase-like glycosyltransferase